MCATRSAKASPPAQAENLPEIPCAVVPCVKNQNKGAPKSAFVHFRLLLADSVEFGFFAALNGDAFGLGFLRYSPEQINAQQAVSKVRPR